MHRRKLVDTKSPSRVRVSSRQHTKPTPPSSLHKVCSRLAYFPSLLTDGKSLRNAANQACALCYSGVLLTPDKRADSKQLLSHSCPLLGSGCSSLLRRPFMLLLVLTLEIMAYTKHARVTHRRQALELDRRGYKSSGGLWFVLSSCSRYFLYLTHNTKGTSSRGRGSCCEYLCPLSNVCHVDSRRGSFGPPKSTAVDIPLSMPVHQHHHGIGTGTAGRKR